MSRPHYNRWEWCRQESVVSTPTADMEDIHYMLAYRVAAERIEKLQLLQRPLNLGS